MSLYMAIRLYIVYNVYYTMYMSRTAKVGACMRRLKFRV